MHKSSKRKSIPYTDSNDFSVEVNNGYHLPVMKAECCDFLNITPGGIYVDCTLGAGGHTKEILARGGRVIGLDQDPDAIAKASELLHEHIQSGSLEIIQSNFRNIKQSVARSKIANGKQVSGVLMDLGVSSHQINEPSRGFSFSNDGPLDMRMDKGTQSAPSSSSSSLSTGSMSALHIVNTYDTTALADVLYQFGDEQRSRQIAREIVASRPLWTTGQLDQVISRITSFKDRPKTLAKCFQALRIVVNDEMGALDEALTSMQDVLQPGGRLVVMSYHSLEDRRVKTLIRTGSVLGGEETAGINGSGNPWKTITKRAVSPMEKEVTENSRSRSAKLRVAERR